MSKITDVGAAYSFQFERMESRIDQLERELAEAVAAERERCAKVCERNIDAPAGTYQILMAAAKEIRKGE